MTQLYKGKWQSPTFQFFVIILNTCFQIIFSALEFYLETQIEKSKVVNDTDPM